MEKITYEVKHYTKDDIPCFCHFGYISAHHTPFPPNWHKDIEVFVCTKGEGYIQYENENVHFTKGETVVVNSGISHRSITDSHVEYFYLIINSDFIAECGFDIETMRFQKKICDKELYQSFIKIVEITHSNDKFRVLKTRLYLSEYLLMLVEKYVKFTSTADNSKIKLHAKKALEYLQFNYSKPITVNDIAEYVGIGRTRLSKEFKEYTGLTLLEQTNIIRCKNAKNMILSGVKISDAAESCGFENRSYFTKIYKKYNHELPTETKANHS